jgi:hypothetical protein
LRQIVVRRGAFFNPWREVSVHPQDMVCNHAVPGFVHIVCYDKEQIKTREKGVGKCNILVRVLVDIVLSHY